MQASRIVGRAALAASFVLWTLAAAAQTPATLNPAIQKPGMAPRPPLLFRETWRLPPHTGEPNDENTRFTPAVVTIRTEREATSVELVGCTAPGQTRPR